MTDMKKVKILFLGLAIFSGSSCSSYLDQYPHAAISPDAVTEDDIPAMRNGMYNSVQNAPGVYSYMIFDILGGDMTQTSYNPIDVINTTLSPLSSTITNQWYGYYEALYQVNNMIAVAERFPGVEESASALGEAHYFRAYIYMNLVTRWGDVPIIRVNTMEKVARDPAEDVWRFIDEELDLAESALGPSESYYYVSSDAVKALKARVRLYEGRYEEAAAIAEGLITSGQYSLDDFTTIFDISRPTNSETIFAFLNLNQAESSINISDLCHTYGYVNKGQGRYLMTDKAVALFSADDNRASVSILDVDGVQCMHKYPSGQAGRDPFIVSRIGEMYLISAEAQGYPDGMARLNELRAFRGLPGASVSNAGQFMDVILDERRRELMGENHIWYDFVRTGTAVERLGIQTYQQLFPIPGKELQLNDLLEPNPGY